MPAPATDPTTWFLTADEIAAARGGVEPARTLQVMTSGNKVEPLIDGAVTLRRLREDISRTSRGGFVHLTAWMLDADIEMVQLESRSTVFETLVDRASNGVETRILMWDALFAGEVRLINQQSKRRLDPELARSVSGSACVLDGNFPFAGAHHQKSAVVVPGGKAVGYCGGVDPARDRWDTSSHDKPGRGFLQPRRNGFKSFPGWHDVHVRIEGEAALDIERNFRDRWNDPRQRKRIEATLDRPLPPVHRHPGTHHVQVLRTFACKGGYYPSFAPRGETTARSAYLKAINQAQRYIYIEDQYLWSEEIAQALAQVLPRIQGLVIVVPAEEEIPVAGRSLQRRFLEIVRPTAPDKVHVFHLQAPPSNGTIYVHAKVMIIDDVYAVVGSSNIGQRSMTHDSELSVAVIDQKVENGTCVYARDLRIALWEEHLGFRLTDPVKGIETWQQQARNQPAFRVRAHPTPTQPVLARRTVSSFAERDGRCPPRRRP